MWFHPYCPAHQCLRPWAQNFQKPSRAGIQVDTVVANEQKQPCYHHFWWQTATQLARYPLLKTKEIAASASLKLCQLRQCAQGAEECSSMTWRAVLMEWCSHDKKKSWLCPMHQLKCSLSHTKDRGISWANQSLLHWVVSLQCQQGSRHPKLPWPSIFALKRDLGAIVLDNSDAPVCLPVFVILYPCCKWIQIQTHQHVTLKKAMRRCSEWGWHPSRLKQQSMFQTLRSIGILPSEFEKRSRPCMSQRKWHFQKQIGVFACLPPRLHYWKSLKWDLPSGSLWRRRNESLSTSKKHIDLHELPCIQPDVTRQPLPFQLASKRK